MQTDYTELIADLTALENAIRETAQREQLARETEPIEVEAIQ